MHKVLTSIFNYCWQRIWGKPVLDRVGLIIQIFNAHAQTKEAKLQVFFFSLFVYHFTISIYRNYFALFHF